MQPPEKLREALSSKEAFTRTYLVFISLFFLKFSRQSGILVCFKKVFVNIKKLD